MSGARMRCGVDAPIMHRCSYVRFSLSVVSLPPSCRTVTDCLPPSFRVGSQPTTSCLYRCAMHMSSCKHIRAGTVSASGYVPSGALLRPRRASAHALPAERAEPAHLIASLDALGLSAAQPRFFADLGPLHSFGTLAG